LKGEDKPLSKRTKRKKTKPIKLEVKIRSERRDITTDTTEIQRIIMEYFEKLFFNKLENIEEINKFIDTCDLRKMNQECIENQNRTIMSNEI
jgi:hypothetical protein